MCCQEDTIRASKCKLEQTHKQRKGEIKIDNSEINEWDWTGGKRKSDIGKGRRDVSRYIFIQHNPSLNGSPPTLFNSQLFLISTRVFMFACAGVCECECFNQASQFRTNSYLVMAWQKAKHFLMRIWGNSKKKNNNRRQKTLKDSEAKHYCLCAEVH